MLQNNYSLPGNVGRHFGFPHQSGWDAVIEDLSPLGQFTWFREIVEELDYGKVTVRGLGDMLMLGGYSYLGLNKHPKINEAIQEAAGRFGTGTSGSRWLAGHTSLHQELEELLSTLHGTEDTIVFSSGYVANVSTVASLVNRNDLVIFDKLSHASIVDGCRFAQAEFQRFRHGDLEHLRTLLQRGRDSHHRRLVVVDGVYSMSGDVLDAPSIVDICKEFEAILMVDECHSHFILGTNGHGIKEYFGLAVGDDITLEMGTLSKAIPSNGGYISASTDLCNFLRREARGFIYSGATSAVMVSAAIAAIKVFQSEGKARIEKLQDNSRTFRQALRNLGFKIEEKPTPIVPILVGGEKVAAAAAAICQKNGVFIHPVFPPVVPAGKSILRASISANHRKVDLIKAAHVIVNSISNAKDNLNICA